MRAPTTLTRRELYDLVWARPMRELAADFGISDVGLSKTCKRHRVPTPSRGYWAKVRAGKKVKQTHFAEVSDPLLDRIEIRGALSGLPQPVREIVDKSRAERKATRKSPPPSPTACDVQPIRNVHEAVRRSAAVLRKTKSAPDGAVHASGEGLCTVAVKVSSVERVIAFLDRLARQLDATGLPLQATSKGLQVSIGPDSASFSIIERTRREKHIPTEAELLAERRRQERFQRSWQMPGSFDDVLWGRAYPEYDVVHTGALAFQVEGFDDGARRTWADGKIQRLEGLVDDIAAGLMVLLALRKAKREAWEERERQHRERERRRTLARLRGEREKKREAFLQHLMNLHDEVQRLRTWLQTAEPEAAAAPHGEFARLITWTRERLITVEKRLQSPAITRELQAGNLFPEVDDLHDPLGDPSAERSWLS